MSHSDYNVLDQHLEGTGLFYVRFMDEILVLASTRWKLRPVVGVVNHILASLKLEKNPEQTLQRFSHCSSASRAPSRTS